MSVIALFNIQMFVFPYSKFYETICTFQKMYSLSISKQKVKKQKDPLANSFNEMQPTNEKIDLQILNSKNMSDNK